MTKQLLADDLEPRLDAFLPHNPILLIEYENTRLLPVCFLGRITPKIHDRDAIADFPELRGRAVEVDQPFVWPTVNHVGLKAVAVGDVAYKNLLVLEQINQLSQIGRDPETAFAMQTRPRPRG